MIDLELIKRHLNLDHDEDDEYIIQLSMVAEEVVTKHLNLTSTDSLGTPLPLGVTQACLLLIGTLYNNRESISTAKQVEVPLAYQYLLSHYINY